MGVWAGVDWGGGIAPLAAVLAQSSEFIIARVQANRLGYPVGGPTPLPVKGQREIGGERAVCWSGRSREGQRTATRDVTWPRRRSRLPPCCVASCIALVLRIY